VDYESFTYIVLSVGGLVAEFTLLQAGHSMHKHQQNIQKQFFFIDVCQYFRCVQLPRLCSLGLLEREYLLIKMFELRAYCMEQKWRRHSATEVCRRVSQRRSASISSARSALYISAYI